VIGLLKKENEMRLGVLLAVGCLVLVTLVSSFSQTFQGGYQPTVSDIQSNTDAHIGFNRELADHSAKLDALKAQHDAMSDLPIRMARIEERLEVQGQMVWAILAGVLGLIGKEIWAALRSLRNRRPAENGGG
jgi:hypothetical protein